MTTPLSVSELNETLWGGPTRTQSSTVTIATTVTEIVPADPNRVYLSVVNLSTNRGFADFERQVSTSRGLPLTASGGGFTSSIRTHGEAVQRAMYGINETASGTWYIQEVIRLMG